jgi:hypothetical protein
MKAAVILADKVADKVVDIFAAPVGLLLLLSLAQAGARLSRPNKLNSVSKLARVRGM